MATSVAASGSARLAGPTTSTASSATPTKSGITSGIGFKSRSHEGPVWPAWVIGSVRTA